MPYPSIERWLNLRSSILQAENVTKIYPNGVKANVDVSIDVYDGEVVCIIGPNGAGKTTLVRQIMGILKPTSGRISVFGVDPIEKQDYIRKMVSYTPQLPLTFPAHKVIEVAKYVAELSNTPWSRVQEVLEYLGLWSVRDRLGYQLSVGQRKLLLLAMSLIKGSDLIILDEPTSFVDVFKKRTVWDILAEERKSGKTILMVSHDLEEVKRLCDRVYLMVYGRVVTELSSLEKVRGGAEVRIVSKYANKIAQLFKRGDISVSEALVSIKYQSLLDALEDLENLAANGEYRDDVRVYLEYPSLESLIESAVRGSEVGP